MLSAAVPPNPPGGLLHPRRGRDPVCPRGSSLRHTGYSPPTRPLAASQDSTRTHAIPRFVLYIEPLPFWSPGSLTSGCRHDCSLGMLTKKFLTLIDNATDGVLDLNKAAETLKVQKRRIYDITNVLEGVGLIEKKSKNNIRWKGASTAADRETEPETAKLRQDMKSLEDQERSLDDHIRIMTGAIQALSDNPLNKPRLYVTDEDVTSLPCFANDTIFAVKAPPGTTLEVPDPREAADPRDGQMRYRIVLRSTRGPIDVYLVQHTNNGGTTSQQGAAAPSATSAEPAGSTVGPAERGGGGGGGSASGAVGPGNGGGAASGGGAGAAAAAAADAGGSGGCGGGISAPPTAVKPELVPSGRSAGPGLVCAGLASPSFPFALPGTSPLSAAAGANGPSSFFNSVLNSPTGAVAVDPLHMGPLTSPGLAGRVSGTAGGVGEMDPATWYDGPHEPPLISTFYQGEDDDNFFTAPL
ncbi:E2F transcription factor family [Volvox carteri f. nagariensis]|uniref:E2F transcription factor family n=2 Tax=Volvox carteri f. nagariensis TaxID=3068 RepID=D8TPZ9_VOLCA|nr:E2F transcription factor family [Volvox carteri f. nagariensis]EFJ50317.1 E2F transcription factor family [Volvox carteri f. nagariensis]|eukprot:XP_002948442.1 E2F transcription factor family [Volvox carteri f. nagariensis]